MGDATPLPRPLRPGCLVVAVAIAGLIGWAVWAVYVDGPQLEVTRGPGAIQIVGRFLGDYDLGFEHVLIREVDAERPMCEVSGPMSAYLALKIGDNTVSELTRGRSPEGRLPVMIGRCLIVPARRYVVEVRGNNGFAHVRSSHVEVAVEP